MVATKKIIFISVANSEFAPLRAMLRDVLTRAGFDVVVQTDFPHTVIDTVRKLDELLAPSHLVLHIVGKDTGSRAAPAAVADFFTTTPRATFVPTVADRSFFDTLTYMQWEPWLALQRGIDVLVYTDAGHEVPHKTHLAGLRGMRCHADTLMTEGARCGQIVADVCRHFKMVQPEITQDIAGSRILRHTPRVMFGREAWLAKFDDIWINGKINVFTLVAWGGVGKTSLVAHWLNERFVKHNWPGVERYFDWSFYSQGTGESRQTSADLFINKSLEFFGDPNPVLGDPWQRGERLAKLIRQKRTLLVLDGIEPLQYPPTDKSGLGGQLKDPALASLVQALATKNNGLCIITTREHLKNVESLGTSQEEKLETLFRDAAIALLRHLQIVGTEEELAEAWHAAGGHALTLQLLGRFIADAYPHDKDIRHYKEVKLAEADKERQGRSAFKVMKAYENWLTNEDADKQRELAILRLTGLFDRPIAKGCMDALRAAPAIAKLTEPIVGLNERQWNIALGRLISVDLLARSGTGEDEAIDAHPIVREYFAEQLEREAPKAFREAHSRLFDYLSQNTPHRPETVEGLAPLYQAVVHGVHAGRYVEACVDIYIDRILRGTNQTTGFYSWKQLGAIGANLGAVAAFFVEPWSKVTANLKETRQAWLLNEAGNYLRGLGRLTEALQPQRASLQGAIVSEDWTNAAIYASNVSELEVTLGQLTQAVADGRQSVAYADQSGDAFQKMCNHAVAADALHHMGDHATAQELFAKAEQMQEENNPTYPWLASLAGFRYMDLLLGPAERATWRSVMLRSRGELDAKPVAEAVRNAWRVAHERSSQTLAWSIAWKHSLLTIGHDHLTLARAILYRALCEAATLPDSAQHFPECELALSKLRAANSLDDLPKALLTCALYYGGLLGDHEAATGYLDEAALIASRGPMPLYMADVHLHRARLFRDKDELAKAEALIVKHGYGRRNEELADAKAALGAG